MLYRQTKTRPRRRPKHTGTSRPKGGAPMTTTTTIPVAGDPFTAAPAHPSTAQVESSSRPGLFHNVTLEPEESCSCEATIPLCRHIRIARIRAARVRPSVSEALCACNDGWVTIGQMATDPETGEETEEFALYLCE